MLLKLTLGVHNYSIIKINEKYKYYFDGKLCRKNKIIKKEK
jgi:hypothetical protein